MVISKVNIDNIKDWYFIETGLNCYNTYENARVKNTGLRGECLNIKLAAQLTDIAGSGEHDSECIYLKRFSNLHGDLIHATRCIYIFPELSDRTEFISIISDGFIQARTINDTDEEFDKAKFQNLWNHICYFNRLVYNKSITELTEDALNLISKDLDDILKIPDISNKYKIDEELLYDNLDLTNCGLEYIKSNLKKKQLTVGEQLERSKL